MKHDTCSASLILHTPRVFIEFWSFWPQLLHSLSMNRPLESFQSKSLRLCLCEERKSKERMWAKFVEHRFKFRFCKNVNWLMRKLKNTIDIHSECYILWVDKYLSREFNHLDFHYDAEQLQRLEISMYLYLLVTDFRIFYSFAHR